MDDAGIIALFDSRDELAIAELQKKYGAYCRAVAMRILGDEADAEECVNDAYLKVWNNVPPDVPKKLDTYLAGIVRNTAIDRLRRKNAQKSGPAGGFVSADGADGAAEQVTDPWTDPLGLGKGSAGAMIADGIDPDGGRLLSLMEEFLRSISPKKRKIFFARYYYDRSVSDIARITGVPKGTVLSSLKRTREELRAFLESKGIEV